MFNPLNLFSKLIKSGNQNELNRIQKIIKEINLLEKDIEKLSPMALDDPCTPENPKKTTLNDMKSMYQHSIEGKLFN